MQFLYNLSLSIVRFSLQILALFNPKMKLFVNGRKKVFETLKSSISSADKVYWIHCASLGEFEQGRPVIEKLKRAFPTCKVVLTFFSPSGYEVQKNYQLADVVVYLPLDTKLNAERFISLVHPAMAIFVKYEFWPNYLTELKLQKIPAILVSGIFRKDQIFFKNHGAWMRSKLNAFSHFFLQDDNSAKLLRGINYQNITVSGDTRFDRVYDIINRDNSLDFIQDFVGESYVAVAGSTWPEDEDLLVRYILDKSDAREKFIIAPHNVKSEGVENLKMAFGDDAVLFSEKNEKELSKYKVFIIDTVGILTKIYSLANVAYVGGGYTKSGIHNVLEPATFGVPVVIGPNFKKFNEALNLVDLGACISTKDQESVNSVFQQLKENTVIREEKGQIAANYIKDSLGASDKIIAYIKNSQE